MRAKSYSADIVRQFWHWLRTRPFEYPDLAQVNAALRVLDSHAPSDASPDLDEPVFILASSWRSGSTLLQRVLCTDPALLLWGEPFGRLALVPRIVSALCTISPNWPPAKFWASHQRSNASLADSWIANLFPAGVEFKAALQAFLSLWLADSAHRRGYQRWGLKEVRFGSAEARLLTWLFPKAKIVVLVRHPYDAYRSASRAAPPGTPWGMYSRWPDHPMAGAASFARHWNTLSSSWLQPDPNLDYVWMRYEDLSAGRVDFRAIESFSGLRFKEDQALEKRVGGTRDPSGLRGYEKWLLQREARTGMRAFGYSPRGVADVPAGNPSFLARRCG